MIRRVMIAALAFAAPVYLVSAQDTKVSVDMIGIGRMSCAHWRSNREQARPDALPGQLRRTQNYQRLPLFDRMNCNQSLITSE